MLVDTNLLVLLVVGLTDEKLIGRHKNTTSFNIEHFKSLTGLLSKVEVVSTPNILTETSSLVAQIGEPVLTKLRNKLGEVITRLEEIYLESKDAASNPLFRRLGLTDTIITMMKDKNVELLSTDVLLRYECSKVGLTVHNLTSEFYE